MLSQATTLSKLHQDIKSVKDKKLEEMRGSMGCEVENGFWNFCKYLFPHFFKDEQTERIRYAEILRKCGAWSLTGKEEYIMYRKVMVNIFPRFGKSFMLSIWCVWLLWQFPKGSIMRNAHDATLAEKFSRDVRNMIEDTNEEKEALKKDVSVSQRLKTIAPKLTLSRDKKSLNMWALKTAKDVSYFCAGVQGAITGNGCDLAMILDDPVKDPMKALSASFNEDLYDWYLTTHRSRQDRDSKAFGCEIIVMARWSSNDLCSKLLKAEDDWHIVYFDAENENGDSACESIFPTELLRRMRKGFINSGRLNWWKALYRQKVEDIGKRLFPIEQLKRFSPSECGLDFSDERRFLRIGYCDVADEGEDFLSAPLGFYDMATGECYITDVLYTKEPSNVSKVLLAEKIVKNRTQIMVFESNNGGKLFGELTGIEVERIYNDMDKKYTEVLNWNLENPDNIKELPPKPSEYNAEFRHTYQNKLTKILVLADVVLSSVYFLDGALIEGGSDYALFINGLTDYEKERKNEHDDAPDSICSLAKRFCSNGSVQIS